MKSTIKFLGIIALVAVMGFSMAACDSGGGGGGGLFGGGGIATNVRFLNRQPPASLSARSVSRAVIGGTTIDTASFASLSAYYSGLSGTPTLITPSKFQVLNGDFIAVVNGGWAPGMAPITEGGTKIVDYVQGATIVPPQGIPSGITGATAIMVYFNWSDFYYTGPTPTTTFTISAPLAAGHPWREFKFHRGGIVDEGSLEHYPESYVGYETYTNTTATITVPTILLMPIIDSRSFNPVIYYYGTVYKYIKVEATDAETGGFGGCPPGVVVPWNGVTIPSNASRITFDVNFDMTNIIAQYGTAGTSNVKYVLANKFWEGFSLTVNVN